MFLGYNFPTMKKYMAWLGILAWVSIFVTCQKEKYTHDSPSPAAKGGSAAVAPGNKVKPPSDGEEAQGYSPRWEMVVIYRVFGWPEGVTVWALFLTLITIAEQTSQTRKAAIATEDSVGAIKRQTDLMKEQSDFMVEKERAKLRIELGEFQPVKDEHETYWVKGHVSIYGSTEAFIERTEIYASIGAGGIFNPLPEWMWGMRLPTVIRSNAEPIPFSVMVMAADGPTTDDEILPVREAKEFVYVMAKVEFADAFGRKWVLRLRRRFRFIWSDIESPGIGGSWEDSGPASDNGEYELSPN